MSRIVICANCRKRLHRQRNGAWYHNHNASVSCHPAQVSSRRAEPREVTRAEARRVAAGQVKAAAS